jgi:hypothetical protein
VVFYIVVIVAVVAFAFFVSRTSLFRAHLHGHGKDPGDSGTRTEGKYSSIGGTYNRPEKRG